MPFPSRGNLNKKRRFLIEQLVSLTYIFFQIPHVELQKQKRTNVGPKARNMSF